MNKSSLFIVLLKLFYTWFVSTNPQKSKNYSKYTSACLFLNFKLKNFKYIQKYNCKMNSHESIIQLQQSLTQSQCLIYTPIYLFPHQVDYFEANLRHYII